MSGTNCAAESAACNSLFTCAVRQIQFRKLPVKKEIGERRAITPGTTAVGEAVHPAADQTARAFPGPGAYFPPGDARDRGAPRRPDAKPRVINESAVGLGQPGLGREARLPGRDFAARARDRRPGARMWEWFDDGAVGPRGWTPRRRDVGARAPRGLASTRVEDDWRLQGSGSSSLLLAVARLR